MSLQEPILQSSVVEEVIARITDALIKGEFKAGDRLPSELELCRSLGIGRNSLREAIKMLASIGVLQIRRGDGTYVASSVSASMLDPLLYSVILQRGLPYELFELRKELEIDALELAAEKATPEDIRRGQEAIEELEASFQRGETDAERLVALDLAFHYQVFAACHNSLFERIGRTVFRLFMNTIKKALVVDPQLSVANHKRILSVIVDRQPSKAREIVTESLQKWHEVLYDQVSGRG